MAETGKVIIATVLMVITRALGLSAQSDSVNLGDWQGAKTVSMVGLDMRPAYAFSSFRDDVLRESLILDDARKTRMAASVHLKYGFTFTPATKEGRRYPGVWQGVGTAVNMFGNPHGLGTPVSLYVFQGAPIVNFSDRLSLYYEWNFGASIGWKPCDGETARSNLIVGSRVNAYINLGAGVSWRLSRDVALTAGLEVTHFSNGNTSYPNPGVNSAGVRVGVSRSFGRGHREVAYCKAGWAAEPDTLRKRVTYDLTAYGAWRRRVYRGGEEPVLLKGTFGVAGLSFAPMWEVARVFRAGVSLDFQWDQSSDLRRHQAEDTYGDDVKFYRPPFFSQVSTGLSARGELVMPLFSVNIGMGYNFLGPEEARATYQMANLRVRCWRGLYVNIGYQLLNFQRQNNLMLGLGYTFGKG